MGSLVKKSSISSDGVRRRNSSNASTKEEGEEEQVLCSTFSANNSAGQDESLATTDANINSNIAGRCSGIACRCAMLVCLFAGMQYSFNQAVLYRQEQDSIPPGVLRLQRMQRQNKIPHAADVLANNPVHLRFADISQKNAEAMKQLNAQLGQVFNENHTITLADLTDLDRKESLKDVTWEEAALDRGPILDTLHRAGLKVDVQVLQRLPTWSQVVNLYGSKPVIVGRDTVCQAFRDQVPAATRFVGVAGQMNTGTNAMAKYLAQNIQILENEIGYGVLWTVPWYKHAWASLRFRYQYRIPKEHANVLAVVIIRDPYFWMQRCVRVLYFGDDDLLLRTDLQHSLWRTKDGGRRLKDACATGDSIFVLFYYASFS